MPFAALNSRNGIKFVFSCVTALALAACSGPRDADGVYDPFEVNNRAHHETNKQLDKNLVKPVSQAYGTAVPAPVRAGVSNFAENLALPGMVVNDLLQLRLGDAASNTTRFLVNSTIGLAGLLDPADDIGLYARDSDFGETLHVWGVNEGAYVELPILGPTTERDMAGKVVDFVISPTRAFLPDELRQANTAASVADAANSRYRFSDTVDSVLYDSADSYAQARLLYLQNRRFELGQAAGADAEYDDPYEDPYAQ